MQHQNKITKAVLKSLAEIKLNVPENYEVVVEYPADTTHGDYATPVALTSFKFAKERGLEFKSPRELAQAIVDQLQSNSDINQEFESIEIASPGFINFHLSESFLLSKMGQLAKNGVELSDSELTGKKVIVEFTDPNPFKELHIGHLYSNTVGESLSRMHEALGAQVQRVCYQGDVGMHVAKSIWGMEQLIAQQFPDQPLAEVLDQLAQKTLQERVQFLGKSYATGAQAYTENESAQHEMKDRNYLVFIAAQESLADTNKSTQQVVDYKQYVSEELLSSDLYATIKQLYVAGRTWSLEYFDLMYQKMGMRFDDFFFESQVGEIGFGIVQKYLEQGVFEKSQDAVIFPGSKYGLHDRVFINSLGLPTYEAKELGLAPEKFRRFPYDLSLIITGNEIDEYFKVLLKALSLTNPELAEKTTHLSHGMVRLPDGKMSSRTGKILTAEWLLSEATTRMQEYMDSERSELDADYRSQAAEKIGIGAVKYAFLKHSIGKDISFDFDESLSFSGNSGPYLQYTHVRCQSLIKKAETELSESALQSSIAEHIDILLNKKAQYENTISNAEKNILRNLYKYSDILRSSVINKAPHTIAAHLYELAQLFNVFYANEQIVSVSNDELEQESARKLVLVHSVGLVLESGLAILGIETVEQM